MSVYRLSLLFSLTFADPECRRRLLESKIFLFNPLKTLLTFKIKVTDRDRYSVKPWIGMVKRRGRGRGIDRHTDTNRKWQDRQTNADKHEHTKRQTDTNRQWQNRQIDIWHRHAERQIDRQAVRQTERKRLKKRNEKRKKERRKER